MLCACRCTIRSVVLENNYVGWLRLESSYGLTKSVILVILVYLSCVLLSSCFIDQAKLFIYRAANSI